MICPYCGSRLNEDAIFCSKCGSKVKTTGAEILSESTLGNTDRQLYDNQTENFSSNHGCLKESGILKSKIFIVAVSVTVVILFLVIALSKTNANLNRYDERDVFNDLKIKYSLTEEGDAYAEIEYLGDDLDKDEFILTDNEYLRLGDKFSVTLNGENDKSAFLKQHGFLPKIWSRTYTVDSLPKYVTKASDISDKALETIKEQSLDVLNGRIDSYSGNFAIGDDTEYLGMYILTWDGVTGNEILAVYTCTIKSLDGSYPDAKVYIPIAFTDVIVYGNEVSNLENGDSPYHFRLERLDHSEYASIDGFSDGGEMYETIANSVVHLEYCNCEVSGDALAEFGS